MIRYRLKNHRHSERSSLVLQPPSCALCCRDCCRGRFRPRFACAFLHRLSEKSGSSGTPAPIGRKSPRLAATPRSMIRKAGCARPSVLPPTPWLTPPVAPANRLCRKVGTGRTRAEPEGSPQPVMRFARVDEPGYTPFRTAPSSGSRDDIPRCVRARFICGIADPRPIRLLRLESTVDEHRLGENVLAKRTTRLPRAAHAPLAPAP